MWPLLLCAVQEPLSPFFMCITAWAFYQVWRIVHTFSYLLLFNSILPYGHCPLSTHTQCDSWWCSGWWATFVFIPWFHWGESAYPPSFQNHHQGQATPIDYTLFINLTMLWISLACYEHSNGIPTAGSLWFLQGGTALNAACMWVDWR